MKTIVIGGGIAGVQTAYFLLQDGHEVTLVERAEGFALETSFANGGMISPASVNPWNSPGIFRTLLNSVGKEDGAIHVKFSALGQYIGWGSQFVRNSTQKRYHRSIERNFAMAHYSLQCFSQLRNEVPLDFFHAANGMMMVFGTEAGTIHGRKLYNDLSKHGVKAQIMDTNDVVSIEPSLAANRQNLRGGVYFPEDEHGNAREFTQSLARHLEAQGVAMRTGIDVTGFISSGSTISGIHTNEGDMLADNIVVAAGQWSTELVKKLGVSIPIRPVKGSSLTYDLPDWKNGPKMPVIDDDMHVVVTRMGDTMRVAGTAEFCGFDPVVRPERMDLLRRSCIKMFPDLKELLEGREPELEWSGHRPMTPDCLPILGKCGFDNLYLNTGHGYLGWSTGTGTSRAVADMIVGRKPKVDMANYGLDRF